MDIWRIHSTHTLYNNFPITTREGDSDQIRSNMAAIFNFKTVYESTRPQKCRFNHLNVYLAPLRSYRAKYFAMAAILKSEMVATKLIFTHPYFPSPTQLLAYPLSSRSYIALFERNCQKQILNGVHFGNQIWDQKRSPFKWKHWFLVSRRSELSKNVFGYNSPQNVNERFFPDIANLTIMFITPYHFLTNHDRTYRRRWVIQVKNGRGQFRS